MSGDPDDNVAVGYAQPPGGTRFKKGQSGNPKGRPRGRHNEPPYEAVLGQVMTIRIDGSERNVTAAEAFLLHMTKRGLEGDGPAARSTMLAIEQARNVRAPEERIDIVRVLMHGRDHVRPGSSLASTMCKLRMAAKLDPYRETTRTVLEPWLVEAALARMDGRLTQAEQAEVVANTRMPRKVRWPKWWKVLP